MEAEELWWVRPKTLEDEGVIIRDQVQHSFFLIHTRILGYTYTRNG
jgi:hypothetical protein